MQTKLAALSILALAACHQQTAETGNETTQAPIPGGETETPANDAAMDNAPNTSGVTATAKPADRKTLEEPKGPIDPKSTEAAGQVVQHYGALIEQGRFAEAAKAWGNADAASTFARQLQARGLKHLEIGDFGEPEGAAGSIYVTMPVVFYQDAKRSPATVTLRRVNDVDGSTEAQRRWHIERIEWGKA